MFFSRQAHPACRAVRTFCIVSLTLLLASAALAQKPFRFIVYGDTRDGHDVHRKLVAMILTQHPDFVIQTGDLVHTGSNDKLWAIYDDITAPMRTACPVYPARGNHDVGGPGYEAHVTAPFSSGNKLYYSFDHGGSHFIALAVDETTAYGPASKQYAWLENDLKKASGHAKHIFVYFHVPPYSIGAHGSDLDVRQTLCPLFQRYHVSAVLNGHDHIYYRTVRDDIPYIVTGGGGAPLYPTDPKKGAIDGDVWKSAHNIVICDVDGPKVTFTALLEDESQLDKFTVTR